jgi:hypothetical protein
MKKVALLLVVVIVVVGGLWAVNNVDFAGNSPVEASCVTIPQEAIGADITLEEICGTAEEIEAVMLELGLMEEIQAGDVPVTLKRGSVTLTGTLAEVYEILGLELDSEAEVIVEVIAPVVSTPVPTITSASHQPQVQVEPEVADGEIVIDFWGFPRVAKSYRYAGFQNEQECDFVVACEVFGSPGVIAEEDRTGNHSAVLITPDSQYQLYAPRAGSDIPEGGYWSYSGSTLTASWTARNLEGEMVNAGFSLPAISNHEYQVYIRGVVPTFGDYNTPINLSNYDDGFSLVTVYDLGQYAETAGGFFEPDYMEAQVANTMANNCGGGDCWNGITVVVIDLNNLSLSIMTYDYTTGTPVAVPFSSNLDVAYHPASR